MDWHDSRERRRLAGSTKNLIAILKSLCLLAAIFGLAEAGLAFREMAKLTKAAAVTLTEAASAAAAGGPGAAPSAEGRAEPAS